jgi:hypothetical protein
VVSGPKVCPLAASLLIVDVIFLTISYRFKRMKKNAPNPYVNFFMRY